MVLIKYEDYDGSLESKNEDDYLFFKVEFDLEQIGNHYSIISQEKTIWENILEEVLFEERLNNKHIWKFNYWVMRYLEGFNKRKLDLMTVISELSDWLSRINSLLISPLNAEEMEPFRIRLIECTTWLIIINEKEEKYMASKFHPSHFELNIKLLQISSRIDYLKRIRDVLTFGDRLAEDQSDN